MGPLWEGMQSCSRQGLGNVRQRFTADQQLHHFRQLDCQLISVGRSKSLLKVVATKAGRPSSTASTKRASGWRAPRPQPPTPGQRLSLADQGPQGLVWRGQHVGAFLAAWRPPRLCCSAKVGKSRRRRLGKARPRRPVSSSGSPGLTGLPHYAFPQAVCGEWQAWHPTTLRVLLPANGHNDAE